MIPRHTSDLLGLFLWGMVFVPSFVVHTFLGMCIVGTGFVAMVVTDFLLGYAHGLIITHGLPSLLTSASLSGFVALYISAPRYMHWLTSVYLGHMERVSLST